MGLLGVQGRNGYLTPDREAAIERGSRARAARIETEQFAAGQQERVIAELVAAYRNRSLTFEYVIGKVGEIVALRDMIAILSGYETQGTVAKEKAHGSS